MSFSCTCFKISVFDAFLKIPKSHAVNGRREPSYTSPLHNNKRINNVPIYSNMSTSTTIGEGSVVSSCIVSLCKFQTDGKIIYNRFDKTTKILVYGYEGN